MKRLETILERCSAPTLHDLYGDLHFSMRNLISLCGTLFTRCWICSHIVFSVNNNHSMRTRKTVRAFLIFQMRRWKRTPLLCKHVVVKEVQFIVVAILNQGKWCGLGWNICRYNSLTTECRFIAKCLMRYFKKERNRSSMFDHNTIPEECYGTLSKYYLRLKVTQYLFDTS